MELPRFSFGVGDRFAHEAEAQMAAFVQLAERGVVVAPVWNKSNREHLMVGSAPAQTRLAADRAVAALGWTAPYFVDADHIRMDTFERYLEPCDFFTIDVADCIAGESDEREVAAFVARHPELLRPVAIPGVVEPLPSDRALVEQTVRQFLPAVRRAGDIYRGIEAGKRKGTGVEPGCESFVTEISMDETDRAQTPMELLIILAAVGDAGVPIQTIAPKFTGRFDKGVDYRGDVRQFAREFREDLWTIAYAVERYGLPRNLKLSVHSGSDKFSIYPAMREALAEPGAGVHVKTAGTTWLEEVIGLAEAGGEGWRLVQAIYAEAFAEADALCAPYASVIDVDRAKLPSPAVVAGWTPEQFVSALRHRSPAEGGDHAAYNPDLRQLLHVAFKVAAKMGRRYTDALVEHREAIARNVTWNLWERHLRPLFLG